MPKIEVKVTVDDAVCEKVVEALRDAALTDRPGTGKIFVTPIEQLVRIRTGQVGPAAIK